MEKTRDELVNEFYSKPFYMSYSGLNKLLYSPRLFYNHYILRQQEDRDDAHLVEGKVVHSLLLEEDKFDRHFIIIPGKMPSGNTKLVVDTAFRKYKEEKNSDLKTARAVSGKLQNYKAVVLDVLKDIDLHQKLNADSSRLERIITPDTISYWDFLKNLEGKTMIDQDTYNKCKDTVDYIKTDVAICDLLGIHKAENVDVYNEEYIEISSTYPFGLKGYIDNIKVDHEMKIININDVKTTSKTLADFPESVEYYRYWCQAAIYVKLVAEKFSHLQEYSVKFRFVVIDKYNQIYPFEVENHTMSDWLSDTDKMLKEAEWHYTNKNYNLPYKFAIGSVKL